MQLVYLWIHFSAAGKHCEGKKMNAEDFQNFSEFLRKKPFKVTHSDVLNVGCPTRFNPTQSNFTITDLFFMAELFEPVLLSFLFARKPAGSKVDTTG